MVSFVWCLMDLICLSLLWGVMGGAPANAPQRKRKQRQIKIQIKQREESERNQMNQWKQSKKWMNLFNSWMELMRQLMNLIERGPKPSHGAVSSSFFLSFLHLDWKEEVRWAGFLFMNNGGYRPEASLRSQTNSAISSPSMALLFVFALIEFAPAKTGQPYSIK